jgi:hypothetical protein
MSSTLDRWYISGPLGVGTDFKEAVDAQSAAVGWSGLGSLLRHDGWETLNLLDGRAAASNQGPNLNLWGMNAANKAVRLGTISARFGATTDGAATSYMSFHTKAGGGDVSESLRLGGDRVSSFMASGAHSTVIVGAGGNGSIRVRHIDGKDWQGDAYDGLYLNWSTGKGVAVGSPEVNSDLTVYGDATLRRFPTNDTTQSNTALSLINRAAGGAEQRWTLYTSAVAGGWGVTPNGFDIWEYPATAARLRIRPGGTTILTPNGGNVGVGTENPLAKLHVHGGDFRMESGRTIVGEGRLHITGEEILYLLNKAGVIVSRAWGGTGDLVVEGRIGVNGQSPIPRTRGWGGGIHTWDIEVEGTAWSRNGWQTGARDLAENFETMDSLQPGVVVSLHPEHNAVVQSTVCNDTRVCGVVSTEPGVLLGSDTDRPDYEGLAPIALCGRVPCQVVDENGPIQRGDLLTSSSIPGYAMRAEPVLVNGERVYRSGTIVGKALEAHRSGRGVITIFVSPS